MKLSFAKDRRCKPKEIEVLLKLFMVKNNFSWTQAGGWVVIPGLKHEGLRGK